MKEDSKEPMQKVVSGLVKLLGVLLLAAPSHVAVLAKLVEQTRFLTHQTKGYRLLERQIPCSAAITYKGQLLLNLI